MAGGMAENRAGLPGETGKARPYERRRKTCHFFPIRMEVFISPS